MLVACFSDKKAGTLMLICELMDMNIYELIRGEFIIHANVTDLGCNEPKTYAAH